MEDSEGAATTVVVAVLTEGTVAIWEVEEASEQSKHARTNILKKQTMYL